VSTSPPTKAKATAKAAPKKRRVKLLGKRWKLYAMVALAGPVLVMCGVMGYYYVVFSRMIDARIHGEIQRVDPRVFARPFEVRRGQAVSPRQLIDRLASRGLREFYLLTTTAEAYFRKRGFSKIEREEVNPQLLQSHEFQDACPASAVCMRLQMLS